MDLRNKRNKAADEKTDYKVKDRGDLRKVTEKNDENTQADMRMAFDERGDSERKISISKKPKQMCLNIPVNTPHNEKTITKNIIVEYTPKKDGPDLWKTHSEFRKRIRDKYTFKLKPVNKSEHLNMNKNDYGNKEAVKNEKNEPDDHPKKKMIEKATQTKENINHSPSSPSKTDPNHNRKPEKNQDKIIAKPDKNASKSKRKKARKSMIKTITSNSGPMTTYKATFEDQKIPTKPLDIKIPDGVLKKQHKVSKATDMSSLKFKLKASRTSVKEKAAVVRKKTERRSSILKRAPSPETEVAKWAPASIDGHSKPYYEAWVDTTLAAISKYSKKDNLFFEKRTDSLLRSLQRALERPISPELFYENFTDERFTGRIKVTQR